MIKHEQVIMSDVFIEAVKEHTKLVSTFENDDFPIIAKVAEMIISTIENGGVIYLCGNGGSAADCQHIAGEFVGRFKRKRKALPAIALSVDSSVITCIGNDYSFKDTFARQVEALVKSDDILWAFSTSGTSPNILSAVQLAKAKGAKVVAFAGYQNSELEKLSDLCVSVESSKTYQVQQIHQIAYHIICDMVDRAFS